MMSAPRTTLTIRLDEELFAIAAEGVREILDPIPITRIPGAPASSAGLVNVRGRIVPLTDLRIIFGLPCAALSQDSRIVVLENPTAGEDVVAIIADQVLSVSDTESDDIHESPKLGMKWPPELIDGVVSANGSFTYFLNLGRIFGAGSDETHQPPAQASFNSKTSASVEALGPIQTKSRAS